MSGNATNRGPYGPYFKFELDGGSVEYVRVCDTALAVKREGARATVALQRFGGIGQWMVARVPAS